jgi:hypothetical protein
MRTERHMQMLTEISKKKFWHNVNVLPPLLRLGYLDGPGAFLCSEPDELRRCAVTGKMDNTFRATVVLENADGQSQFFQHDKPLTLNEFKAFCDDIMPGVSVCSWGWGKNLLDEHGNVRSDIEYPVRRELGQW